MRKFFLFVFSIALAFSLSTVVQAKTITIGFDELDADDAIFNQYSADGIYFRDALNWDLSGNSPATVVAENYFNNVLQTNNSSNAIYILLTAPITSFNCFKWEPGQGSTETVYLTFYDGSGNIIDTISNSVKNAWAPITFVSGAEIKAIKILGNVVDNEPYYLDDLQFEFASPTNNTTVPEPLTFILLGLGLISLSGVKKRIQK